MLEEHKPRRLTYRRSASAMPCGTCFCIKAREEARSATWPACRGEGAHGTKFLPTGSIGLLLSQCLGESRAHTSTYAKREPVISHCVHVHGRSTCTARDSFI